MDYPGSLAAASSESNRVFDAIENLVLQVNRLWCACREENPQKRRRGCGMWELPSPASKSPTDHRTQCSALPSAPFFQRRPSLFFAAFYGLFVPLVRPWGGFLQGEPELFEQTTHVSRMVADSKLFSDHLSYPLTCPHLSSKTMRWCSLSQKSRQFGAIFLAQTGWCSGRRRVCLQAFHSLLFGALHPLTYGPFRNPQSIGYLRLFPTPLFELEGA